MYLKLIVLILWYFPVERKITFLSSLLFFFFFTSSFFPFSTRFFFIARGQLLFIIIVKLNRAILKSSPNWFARNTTPTYRMKIFWLTRLSLTMENWKSYNGLLLTMENWKSYNVLLLCITRCYTLLFFRFELLQLNWYVVGGSSTLWILFCFMSEVLVNSQDISNLTNIQKHLPVKENGSTVKNKWTRVYNVYIYPSSVPRRSFTRSGMGWDGMDGGGGRIICRGVPATILSFFLQHCKKTKPWNILFFFS